MVTAHSAGHLFWAQLQMEWVSDLEPRKVQAAAALARQRVADAPELPASWLALANILAGLGEFEAATACLRDAVERLPAAAQLRRGFAWALMQQDAFEDARIQIDAALRLAPEDPDMRRSHFELLARTHSWDAAGKSLDALNRTPASAGSSIMTQAKRLDSDSLLAFCEAQLAENPASTDARYFKAVTLAKLGRAEEARAVIALDQLVAVGDLATPPEFRDGETFRNALAEEIRRNPTLGPDPRGKATRDAQQTRQLRQPGAVATEALIRQIKFAVQDLQQHPRSGEPDLAAGPPTKARLSIWAVVCGKDGRQEAHRHPSGWLSGVYYVAAPRLDGANAYRGPLILGALDPKELGVDPPWGTREIEPVPGRLVMFPSYVPHATEPSEVDGVRISVAFDVVPVSG
jgi:hypothetical protein